MAAFLADRQRQQPQHLCSDQNAGNSGSSSGEGASTDAFRAPPAVDLDAPMVALPPWAGAGQASRNDRARPPAAVSAAGAEREVGGGATGQACRAESQAVQQSQAHAVDLYALPAQGEAVCLKLDDQRDGHRLKARRLARPEE